MQPPPQRKMPAPLCVELIDSTHVDTEAPCPPPPPKAASKVMALEVIVSTHDVPRPPAGPRTGACPRRVKTLLAAGDALTTARASRPGEPSAMELDIGMGAGGLERKASNDREVTLGTMAPSLTDTDILAGISFTSKKPSLLPDIHGKTEGAGTAAIAGWRIGPENWRQRA